MLLVKFMNALVLFFITIFAFSCLTNGAAVVEIHQPLRFNEEVLINSSVRSKRDITCGSNQWRCLYEEQCIDDDRKCDGQTDCADESDETIATCFNQDTLDGAGVRCVLPAQPEHGWYTTKNVSHTSQMLSYSCNEGHSLTGKGTLFCTDTDGVWTPEPPVCEKQCRPLESASVNFKCYKQYSTIPIPCDQLQDHNSRAEAECKDSYYSELSLEDAICVRGSWDHTPSCTPECGTVVSQADPLGIGERPAEFEEFPWHVSIFNILNNKYECGGSIFSPKLVVTAAHCVCREGGRAEPASSFSVGAGKFHMDFRTRQGEERYTQKSNVTEIIIGERYRGETTWYQADIAVLVLDRMLVLSSLVRPVCIRFEDINLEGRLGKVAGWGVHGARLSSMLKTMELPFVSYDECYEKSPLSFKSFLTLDKTCAGYSNGTNDCPYDSGGGLVLPRQDGPRQRFYLHGILSIRFRLDTEFYFAETCSSFIAFTDLSKHREWFQKVWARYN